MFQALPPISTTGKSVAKFILKDICPSLISWHFSGMDHFHTYAFHENILSWLLSEFQCLQRPSLRQNLTIRQRTPYLLNRALTTLYKEASLPSVRTRGQIDALTFFKCIRLTSQLTYESIVNFEIEMWIIFLSGSSSLITLNLALTIYNDWRFLLITNDWRRLTFFYIKTHNSCISKRCD